MGNITDTLRGNMDDLETDPTVMEDFPLKMLVARVGAGVTSLSEEYIAAKEYIEKLERKIADMYELLEYHGLNEVEVDTALARIAYVVDERDLERWNRWVVGTGV